jgi:uncharacterized protein (DUF433 family)
MRDPHIPLNPRRVPCLDGTRPRVIDLVTDHVVQGYRAAHLVEPSPDLTPAHLYAALTSDDDHQDTLDAALDASDAQAEPQHQRHTPHPTLVAARARPGRVMRRRSMEVHVKAAITAGLRRRGMDVVTAQEDSGTCLYVRDLEVVCPVIDPEDLAHRIESLPLT